MVAVRPLASGSESERLMPKVLVVLVVQVEVLLVAQVVLVGESRR